MKGFHSKAGTVLTICSECYSEMIFNIPGETQLVKCLECKKPVKPTMYKHAPCDHCGKKGMALKKSYQTNEKIRDRGTITLCSRYIDYWKCTNPKCGAEIKISSPRSPIEIE